ncbi:MAG: hypothetical protein WC881_10830, partial [Elusimicrobiota bacterium]
SLESRDLCGNRAALAADETVWLRAKRFSQTTYDFSEYDDSVGISTGVNVAMSTDAAVAFAAGQSSRTFYVMSVSTGFHNLEVMFDLIGPNTYYYGFSVLPENALTDVSVGTSSVAGALSAVITPNNDGVDDQAFFNFNLGDANQSWHVLLSSVPFKAGIWPMPIWERWGSGQPGIGSVAWDGRYSPWINNGSRVPTGRYFARVEVGGYGGIHDDRASVIVQVPQVAGRCFDLGNGQPPYAPLSGARIQVYGPNGSMFTQTDVNGDYNLPGVAAGVYNAFVNREDFLDGNLNVTVNAMGTVSTFTALSAAVTGYINASSGMDLLLQRAPVLYAIPALSSSSFGVAFSTANDQWGSIMVRSSTSAVFQQTLFSPIRLAAGTTTFDDGGRWDPASSSFVVRSTFKFNLAVGSYTVEATFAGFDRSTAAVYVPAEGIRLNLPEFTRKSSLSGTVSLPANPLGGYISVNAVPSSTATLLAGGFGGVYLPAGVTAGEYKIFNLDAGHYRLRANTNGYAALSSGPISVPASSDVAHVDFPIFTTGAQIDGTVTVLGNTAGSNLTMYVNAWAPGSMNFGSTAVYKAGGVDVTLPYAVKGLEAGATYQLYANISGAENMNLEVLEGMPISAAAPATQDFTFAQSSGVILGTIVLPPGNTDFLNVDMYLKVVESVRPGDVGREFSVISATTMPSFRCYPNVAAAPSGYCDAASSTGTFMVANANTETYEIKVLYKRTGEVRKIRLSVVNGSTSTAFVDLTAQTFSISGAVTNQITNPLFNTNPKIVANALYLAPQGWPGNLSSSTARVLAVRQDISQFNVAISTVFDPAATRVGFLDQGGAFTIANVPAGVYLVRTENLLACATCDVAVPAVGATVRVSTNVTNLSLPLMDGYSVSGTISLDNGIRDARVMRLSVRNRRQEVVRSTYVYLGDMNAGLMANSVDYSFANLPANDFYTLTVEGSLLPIKYVGRAIKFPDPGLAPNGLASNLNSQNVAMKQAAYFVGRIKDTNTGELITADNAALLAPSFGISATANPWVEGGYAVAQSCSAASNRPIDADSYFRVGPLLPEVSYDLRLAQTSWDAGALMQGSQNYAPVVLGGLRPQAGEIRDVGVVGLNQGQSLTGVARSTATGQALGGLTVRAKPSFGFIEMNVETFTNGAGGYTLWVSTSISSQFDVTVAPRDGNTASDGRRYNEVTARNVTVSTAPVNFALRPLLSAVTGYVVPVDAAAGGELAYPFGDKRGYPAAAINLQPAGVVPTLNPLGDIEEMTDVNGRFEVPGLSTGTYSIKATSLGYMVYNATVTTDAAGFRIYTGSDAVSNRIPGQTLVLARGATLTGRIVKSDGSAPNDTEVGGVAAANFGQNEFVMGSVEVNPVAKTVN